MTRRNFVKGVLVGAAGLLFYMVLRKVPLPTRWVPALAPGTSGRWRGDRFILSGVKGSVELNTTGGEVVELVHQARFSVSQIGSALSRKYRIPRETAEHDVRAIIRELEKRGFLA